MKKSILALLGLMAVGTAQADFYSGQFIQGKNGWFFPVDEFRFYTSERPDTINDATQTIAAVNSILTQKKIDLYAAVVPIRARIYEDQLPITVQLPPVIRQRYTNVQAAFKSAGVRAPDLNTIFTNSPERLAIYPLYIKGDHHWAGPGGLLAAQIISKKITDSGKLANLDSVVSTVSFGSPKVSPKTPITPDGGKAAEKQTEMYRPIIVQTEGQSLLDDETFPIAVIGDSFSNGERDGVGLFAFPSLIESLTKRRVYNAAQPGQGPWNPMLEYLKSAAYQDTPPKVLVWEMWEAFLTGDGQGYLPRNFLRRVGPLALGACPQPRMMQKNRATLAPDTMLVFYGLKPGASATVEYSQAGKTSLQNDLDVTEAGMAFAFPGRFGVTDITVKQGNQAVGSLRMGTCTMPQSFVNTVALNGKTIDLAQNLAANQVDLTGFYPSNDGLTSRWALGSSSVLHFLASRQSSGNLSIQARSPFPGQAITVSVNGRSVGRIQADSQGVFKLDTPITTAIGENAIEFQYAIWRAKNTESNARVDKNDPRDLAVSFEKLNITLR